MLKVIKIIVCIVYIGYAYNFVDNKAREEGFLMALLACIVFGFFAYVIYRVLWVWDPNEDKKKE